MIFDINNPIMSISNMIITVKCINKTISNAFYLLLKYTYILK